MAIENIARFAGVLARHQGQVVLVLEEYAAWGGAYWNIPSGRVEDHESPREGARRELAEETGLAVDAADLIPCSTCEVVRPGAVTRAWNFLADVDEPRLRVNDPDGIIQDARWFPTKQATELLRLLPYRPLSEPSVAILGERMEPGAHWSYAGPEAEPVVAPTGVRSF